MRPWWRLKIKCKHVEKIVLAWGIYVPIMMKKLQQIKEILKGNHNVMTVERKLNPKTNKSALQGHLIINTESVLL